MIINTISSLSKKEAAILTLKDTELILTVRRGNQKYAFTN